MEWLLGYPQPIVMANTQGTENFGSYGLTDLDDQYIKYVSTLNLDNSNSILNLIVSTRKKYESLCIVCLRGLLELMNKCDHVLEYVITMPPAQFLYGKFDDWFKDFVLRYITDARKYYYVDLQREEAGKQALEILEKVETKVEQRLNQAKTQRQLQRQQLQQQQQELLQVQQQQKEESKKEEEQPKELQQQVDQNGCVDEPNSDESKPADEVPEVDKAGKSFL
jgi:hypothetical protein